MQLSTDGQGPSLYKLYRKALNNSLLYFYIWLTWFFGSLSGHTQIKEKLVGN
ncbi:hypothetical protein SAMN03159453_00794 [Pseudomonas sp. NFIX28]|jgi:hypothetical protein|nr:hypothetical protein SAMN03159453_00794 [Pseudomonas sp. NFIX28]